MKTNQEHIKNGIRLVNDTLGAKVNIRWFTGDGSLNSFMDADANPLCRSILWLMKNPSSVHQRILQAHGIKENSEGGVFFACRLIHMWLLDGRTWKRSDVTPTLLRLPGAIRSSKRIRGRVLRGIFFPSKERLLDLRGRRG